MTMTNYTLDTFIAHKMSELTQCGAPEMTQDRLWLNEFILRTIFQLQLDSKTRAYLFNFLRRTESATYAYSTARSSLLEYFNTPRNVISPYFRALNQIEICVSQCYQAYGLLARAFGKQIFTKGSNSAEERLQRVYVDSKHMEDMISGGKLPGDATAAIWITNTGVESATSKLSFVELHGLLQDMHELAEQVAKIGTQPSAP